MKISGTRIMKRVCCYGSGLFVILLTGLLALFTACGEEEYKTDSLWLEAAVTVDGDTGDWLGKLSYIEENGISIGVQNDRQNLYICLTTEDPGIRAQVLRAGLTVWFDPDSGKDKSLGIRFPMGTPKPAREGGEESKDDRKPVSRLREEGEVSAPREGGRFSPPAPPMRDVLLLGPGEEQERQVAVKDLRGIEVAVDATGTVFVYELKALLQAGDEAMFGIGTSAGATIGFGLEIPESKMDSSRSGMRVGMDGMGRAGRGGGGMRPGGGRVGGNMRPGGMAPSRGKAVKMWVTTRLAAPFRNSRVPLP